MRIAICDDENIWINHIEEYIKKINDCSIKVTIYKLKESKKASCVAKFKYDNIEYLLTGTMKQQEFEKILNNLFFPK